MAGDDGRLLDEGSKDSQMHEMALGSEGSKTQEHRKGGWRGWKCRDNGQCSPPHLRRPDLAGACVASLFRLLSFLSSPTILSSKSFSSSSPLLSAMEHWHLGQIAGVLRCQDETTRRASENADEDVVSRWERQQGMKRERERGREHVSGGQTHVAEALACLPEPASQHVMTR